MSVEVLRGAAADTALADDDFRQAWERLAAETLWSSVFQSPTFCLAWYGAYRDRFEPLLVVRRAGPALRGLMPLVIASDGRLLHAGDHQCEYQGWLATPDDPDFGTAAVDAVLAATRAGVWSWAHAAPGLPIETIEAAPSLAGVSHESRPCPVLDVRDADFLAGKERGRLRTHRNHFGRRGLRYERVTDPARARQVLDRLATWCDLRQGAAHDVLPFAADPDKLEFHRRLLAPGSEFWLSALWLDDGLLAAHLGPCDGDELAIGIQAYDPREGRRSPGAILLLELAADLARSGGRTLDLTPGGDPWKERWASRHRDVHGLVLHRGRVAATMAGAGRTIEKGARGVLRGLGADPAQLRERLALLSGGAPAAPAEPVPCVMDPVARPTTAAQEVPPDRLDRLLVQAGAALDDPALLLAPTSRLLGEGWRPWAPIRAASEPGLPAAIAWTPPDEGWIDLSDTAAPRCRRDPHDPEVDTLPADTLLVLPSPIDPAVSVEVVLELAAGVGSALAHEGPIRLLLDMHLAEAAGSRLRALDHTRRAG